MLIKILPQQLEKFWDFCYPLLVKASPDLSSCEGSLYLSLSEETSQLWFAFDGVSIVGVLLTQVLLDSLTNKKQLLIRALFAENGIVASLWETCATQLYKFAVGLDCASITAFTDSTAILKRAEYFGFTARTFLYKDL